MHMLGDFPTLVKNRLAVGECRYGDPFRRPGETPTESGDMLLERMLGKLFEFALTRNAELLVDIAAYAALIYRFDDSPRAHFKALDQGGDRASATLALVCRELARLQLMAIS